MTTKGDNVKTNDFLRLRKLRLQQVREQSKDIAKKIRQRAKVEQLRHVTNVDTNKEREYLQRQKKLVNRLEQLYSKSLQNVGASHKNACKVNEEEIPEKTDLSKLRGKEAAAVLKRKKQEKLDEQKKLLDRKLQAREVANVLSREKISIVANNLIKSSSSKSISNEANAKIDNVNENLICDNIDTHKDKSDPITKNDMGTQWEFDEIPNEWEPNIPILPIPNDDSVKNSADDNVERLDQSLRSRRLNLFALSDEMPSSLRGGVTNIADDRIPMKPSLTLVSEYLQNRGLRLREPVTTQVQRKKTDDLQSIKQTLLKTRASRTDGSVLSNICHVLDEQVIPVPCWRAERNCEFCSHVTARKSCRYKNIVNNNNAFNNVSSLKPGFQHITSTYEKPVPCSKYHKCHEGLKIPVSGKSNIEHSNNSDDTNRVLSKKNSVTVYDHNTRDTRDFPHNADELVVRDQSIDDDAYSQAVKEASVVDNSGKSHILQQEARSRLAMTRQNVDKEYRDTLSFLNSLPKEKPARCIRTAYMDEDREQAIKDKRQHKLQQEYKKIEKQGSRHHCKHARNKLSAQEQNRSKSKSPVTIDIDNNVVNKEFQYSWLPIPENDSSMAIHTIPNNVKDNKPGNTVKFSSVDTYHEYRSRHKHTPPTKDNDSEQNKRVVETVIIQDNINETGDSSLETDNSSVENLQVRQDGRPSNKAYRDKQLADAERIIIYKVMDSKRVKNKKHKIKKKSHDGNDIDKYPNVGVKNTETRHRTVPTNDATNNITTNTISFTQLQEGIYKNVSANGDNIASLYFSDDQQDKRCNQDVQNKSTEKETQEDIRNENGDKFLDRTSNPCGNCKSMNSRMGTDKRPSAATSTSSFKTAVNDKGNNILLDDGCIKFVDEGGKDTKKFYVGASGFLKDDAYEVIIQLRKKETERNGIDGSQVKDNAETRTPSDNNINDNNLGQQSIAVQSVNDKVNSSNNQNETERSKIQSREKLESIATKKNKEMYEQTTLSENEVATPKKVNLDAKQDVPTIKPTEITDKGISTPFCDTYAIPDNVPKVDPVSRPVTSICTQTTLNSPISRPVFMHLSSSTSTTYMSPPDLILPRYLRKGSSESCDDTYEPVSNNLNSQNVRHTGCSACKCAKCKKRVRGVRANTPPNSTRSTDQTSDNFVIDEQHKKCTHNQKTIKSHKCTNRSDGKICSRQKFKRSTTDNKRFHSGSNFCALSNKKSRVTSNNEKVTINPVIENYVKKLLALNKEGLKAIEVVNQECSAVNTPGSSVIGVPSNINKNNTMVCNKISLEQIKNNLEKQILNTVHNKKNITNLGVKSTGSQTEKNIKMLYKYNKKRPVHKVKSFNVSKHLIKTKKENRRQSAQSTIISTSPCSLNSKKENIYHCSPKSKKNISQSEKSSPTRKFNIHQEISNNTSNSETSKESKKTFKSRDRLKNTKTVTKVVASNKFQQPKVEVRRKSESYPFTSHKINIRSHSSASETSNDVRNRRLLSTPPVSISTQTNQVDSEIEFMKLAENKLQNMEKIADLTEKCTKRLSNLAKVLEEVRKNKSLAYSQISTSDCTSDSDRRSDKMMQTNTNRPKTFNPVEVQTLTEALVSIPTGTQDHKNYNVDNIPEKPILMDLPKPDTFKTPSPLLYSTESNKADVRMVTEQQFSKIRGKPPPALNRMNIKHVPDFVIPHELSTVVEVDSPMSIKTKSVTTQIDNKHEAVEVADDINLNKTDIAHTAIGLDNKPIATHDLMNIFNTPKKTYESLSTDTSVDSKLKMMDLKDFNEIMLKPFISLKDYAKQYNLDEVDGQTSLNGFSKEEIVNEELSSLHSVTSIPDVMAELLKRNLISEPFKFETTSNVNSTTVSSESTLSLLALSRARKDKKKSAMLVKNKENIAETSVSLSLSSNPDLEYAFQKLGMGWASSTLKKTKERLALSSSSNTSSSSIPQFKVKSFNYQEVPELSPLLSFSNNEEVLKLETRNLNDTPKNTLQQTSMTNSMTVKEFLTNELANKITFSNKTNRNNTEDEFISLCETKIPEEMKHLSQKPEVNEKSVDSVPSGNTNRARTSTPVQIFKSMAYHSTSSSNTSNGLFSNADDLSSVKGTSNSIKNHSTSDKDDLTIPNYSLKTRKEVEGCNKSD